MGDHGEERAMRFLELCDMRITNGDREDQEKQLQVDKYSYRFQQNSSNLVALARTIKAGRSW